MYQMHVQVNEYLGCVGVKAVLSDVSDFGQVSPVAAIPERMFEVDDGDFDDVTALFVILERFAARIIDPGRVAPGVSQK